MKNENFDFEDSGFTQTQLQELEDVEESVQSREKEIEKVADSIKELQTIFKELAVLIIDQVRSCSQLRLSSECFLLRAASLIA